jgi:hypothetical protein
MGLVEHAMEPNFANTNSANLEKHDHDLLHHQNMMNRRFCLLSRNFDRRGSVFCLCCRGNSMWMSDCYGLKVAEQGRCPMLGFLP